MDADRFLSRNICSIIFIWRVFHPCYLGVDTMDKGIKHLAIPCEVWSRVCGYFRPEIQYNPGMRQAFWDRTNVMNSKKQERDGMNCK